MMKTPPSPQTSQPLSPGQTLHLHVNAGDELQILSGEAHIEQPLWLAEHMLMQRCLLAAGQIHRCERSGWVSLTSHSVMEFKHAASAGWLASLYHAMQRTYQLRTKLAHFIDRKTHHAQ